jgi:hypothetical protein
MRYRKSIIAAFVVATLALLPATAANASTVTSDPAPSPAATPDTTTTYQPMVVHGYDAQVAAENGYKIVTNADGTQDSVPVTAAAAAQQQQADQLRANAQAESQSTATPAVLTECGYDWVSGSKIANNTVAFNTGFLVYLAGTHYTWTVNAVGFITANHWTSSGGGPASGTKNWNGAIPNVIGPGIGGVPGGSASAAVILVDGTVCYSEGISFSFG